MARTAILVGATGLIGHILLQKLVEDKTYNNITVVSRRPPDAINKKIKLIKIDFDNLIEHASEIVGDDIFCCIGTIQKKTPDLEVYKKIDYQYPLDLADIGLRNGSTSYNLVSSMGANPNSSFFYPLIKGELERDLSALPFESINIFRPSLLDGHRTGTRKAENFFIKAMRVINPLLFGPLKKYRSIKVEAVAEAMLRQAKKAVAGIHIYQSDEIVQLVAKKD